MTDTSLKNSKGWYNQEQSALMRQFSHNTWKYKCISKNTAFPCAGINMPMMTNGYNNGLLSGNAPDIESALLGIGSANLVTPKPQVKPDLKFINNIKFFNRLETVMPKPLVVEKYQRPNGPFC